MVVSMNSLQERRTPPGATNSITSSLIRLVLTAVVPLLVFGGGAAWVIIDQKKTAIASELGATARALQVAVDRELVNQFAAMQVLATAVSLDAGKLPAFEERARRVVKSNKQWASISLIEPRSHLIIAGSFPIPTPHPVSRLPSRVDEVVRTRKSLVAGVLRVGTFSPDPRIVLMSPVVRDNEVRYVLAVAMHPKSVSDVFTEQRFSASWTGAIVDSQMLVAGRSREAERFFGVRATPTLVDRITAAESGMFTALNQEGDTVYTVFSRSPITGWTVAIGVPAREVDGPIQRTLLQLAGVGGALLLFALALAWGVGREIVRRRHAYEDDLRESEERFRLLFDRSVDAIVLGTPEGCVLTANP